MTEELRDYLRAAQAFAETPSATNWGRLIEMMRRHQDREFDDLEAWVKAVNIGTALR